LPAGIELTGFGVPDNHNVILMKKIILIAFYLMLCFTGFSQDQGKNIYSGGMLILQPGYVFAENSHQQIRDSNFGLGGMLRFYIFKYLTAGIFGGSQKTGYPSTNSQTSSISIGYGGPMLGVSKKAGKFRYTAAVFAGPGTIRNLHVENQDGNALTEAYYYKESSFVWSPMLSVDFALTGRLNLTLQGVCLVAKFNEQPFYNPVLQMGVLFNR